MNSLGIPVDAPLEPAVERLFHVLGAQAGGSSMCRISMAEFLLPSTRSRSIRQWALCTWASVPLAGQVLAGGADAEGDRAVIVKRVRHDVHIIAGFERAPDHQLSPAAHAVGVILPGDAAIAHFLDDRRERIALKRRHERAERAGVLGLAPRPAGMKNSVRS